jgi:hypothetical protein
MSVDMIAPEWMRSPITAAEYDSWSEEPPWKTADPPARPAEPLAVTGRSTPPFWMR